MRPATLLLAALLPLTLTACGEAPDNHPDKPVTQRRAAFQKILKAFEPMGVQMRKGPYDAKKFLEQAQALAAVKDGPWAHFGPDSNYPPTRAKAAVWSEAERFAQERQNFLQVVDRLAVAAESRDEKQVRPAYEAVHDSCRSCHKTFKGD